MSGPCKELFTGSAHDKSDNIYVSSMRQLVAHQTKLLIMGTNRKSFYLTAEVVVGHSRSSSCICGLIFSSFRLWNDVNICSKSNVISISGYAAILNFTAEDAAAHCRLDLERRRYSLLLLPVIVRHLRY